MNRIQLLLSLPLWLWLPVALAAPAAIAASSDDAASSGCLKAVLAGRENSQTGWCDPLINRLKDQPDLSRADAMQLAAAYHNRAVLLLRGRQFELADSDLSSALGLQPQMAAAYLTRGNLRLAQGRFTEALAAFNQAITLSNGAQPEFFINRALALSGLGDIAAAEQDVLRARGTISPSGSAAPREAGFR